MWCVVEFVVVMRHVVNIEVMIVILHSGSSGLCGGGMTSEPSGYGDGGMWWQEWGC